MRELKNEKIYRIIDANLNRSKEGLRVCEDVARFVLNEKKIASQYKALRHRLNHAIFCLPSEKISVIQARDVRRDVGRESTAVEFKRKNIADVFYANSQRIKESIRVLEEFTKLINARSAETFKRIRYRIYDLERDVVKRL